MGLDDWLANTASMIPIAGSYLAPLIKGIGDQQPGQSVGQSVGNAFQNDLKNSQQALAPVGQVLSGAATWAAANDPSQIVTKPVMGALHDVGIGQQGDQWDTGLVGMTGDVFNKIGRLSTFVALAGLPGQNSDRDAQSAYNARAWSMAFAGHGAPDFGDVVQAGYGKGMGSSIVTDPNGLSSMKSSINSTWYGSTLSGALDFAMYSVTDPTRGLAKGLEFSRAAKYVASPQVADRLANVANSTLDAGGTLPSGASAKVSNFTHAATPGVDLNDATQAGVQLASKAAFDHVTDTQAILNRLEPTLGMGGTAPRAGLPVVAEMYADAAKATTDVALQRQIKLNIDYALSGSDSAKSWLADNYPVIAAKGVRTTTAPAEFSLLEDAMQGYHDAYNVATPHGRVMGPSGPNPGADFDLTDYITRHYSDPARQAELQAYGEAVQKLQQFRNTIDYGGPDGGALSFATSGEGTQVAPRALESLKYALNQKVADGYLYKTGPSGMMVRVLNNFTTYAAPNGFLNVVDPVVGGQQLANHMKQYQGTVEGLDADVIRQTVEHFQKLDQQGRVGLVQNVNSAMLSGVAAKYGYSGDQLAQLINDSKTALSKGRAYATAEATAAAAAGKTMTALNDMSGVPTFLDTRFLQNHLDQTTPILDFNTADLVARQRTMAENPTAASRLQDAGTRSADLALGAVAKYHTLWKLAMIGRPGLLIRSQLDTGLRGTVTIGAATQAAEAYQGVLNAFKNRTGIGDAGTMATSALSQQYASGLGDVAASLSQQSAQSAEQIATRSAQAQRASDLADLFKTRQRDNGKFTPLTKLYRAKEQEARDLANRLAGNATTVGTHQPLGLQALQSNHDVMEPVRQANINQLRDAQAAALEPQAIKKRSITSTPVTHEASGVKFTGSPVMSDLEAATLRRDVNDGSNTLSDLFMGTMDRGLYKQRIDPGNWSKHVTPDDVQWAEKYAVAAHDLQGSHTLHRMLNEKLDSIPNSPEAYLRSYLSDAKVQHEFRTSTGGGTTEEFQRWLSDLTTHAASMAPNEQFRQALLSGRDLTPQEVSRLAPEVRDRFPIFGPDIYRDTSTSIATDAVNAAYKYTLDLPDVYLSRVPVYNALYHKNVQSLLPEYAQAAKDAGTLVDDNGSFVLNPKDALDLHTRAKQAALNDVHRDMYDVTKMVGAHGAMRYVAPFFNPWKDAMESWGRLIYDDPAVWGKLLRYSQTPDMLHLTVDQNGNPVHPFDGTSGQDKRIMVPLVGAQYLSKIPGLSGMQGLTHVGVTVGSLNTITQGNTPFSPGFGPLVQVPAQVLIADVLPRMAPDFYKFFEAHPENPINQMLFMRPGDVPKGDLKTMIGSQMPAWMRYASDYFMGDQGFGNTYTTAFGTRFNDGIRQFRDAHGGADPSAKDMALIKADAENTGRAAAVARAVSTGIFGMSGSAVPQGQFYVDKMHALVAATAQLKAMGTTPEKVFAQNYPSASNLNWSFSQNEGGLQATVNATSDYLRYRKTMNDHPDAMWWIAGPDNLVNAADPNGQFSGGAYNTQLNQGLRSKYSEADLIKQDQVAMGAGRWNAFKQSMRLYMDQNGITSLHAGNAGDLAGLQQRYEDGLRQQFPEWAAHVDSTNIGGGRDREINQIKDVLQNPPSPDFLQRPDVKMTEQYLMAREALIHEAQAQNVTNWQNSSSLEPYRAALYAYGYQMASSDIVFHQAWTKLFEGEFYHDIQAAKKAEQTSTTLGPTPVGGQ